MRISDWSSDVCSSDLQFLNQQNLTNSDGGKSEDAGPLYGARAVADVESTLSRLIGLGTNGVSSTFRVLAQIGVNRSEERRVGKESVRTCRIRRPRDH